MTGSSLPAVDVGAHVDRAVASGGQPLSTPTRSFMEPRFSHDFSRVRVHTGPEAATSAAALGARAFTMGSDVVFGAGSYKPETTVGQRLIAHELAHVIQQSSGRAPTRIARTPADADDKKPETAAQPKLKPKPQSCQTGCAQRWGQDTTCSKWGYSFSQGEGDKAKTCCNSWPWSLENYARTQLNIAGAASCPARHEREIATVAWGQASVQVLCSDTIPSASVGETTNAKACSGSISQEVIELSPNAMQDLSGQTSSALHVQVCYSGSKKDLCLHNGPGAKARPKPKQCLTRGCDPPEGTPASLGDTGWPRV